MSNADNNLREASPLDIRCSTACTRAGVASLLLVVVMFSLLGIQHRITRFNHLGNYLDLRLKLEIDLEELKFDPCWQKLCETEPKDKIENDWDLNRLLKYECQFKNPVSSDIPHEKRDNRIPESDSGPRPPPPPTGLTLMATVTIDAIKRISDTMNKLCDDDQLALAGQYSFRYSASIWKWQRLRDSVLTQVSGQTIYFGLWSRPDEAEPVPVENPRGWAVGKLTIKDIKLLAEYEMPEPDNIESVKKELETIFLPNIGRPLTFGPALLIVEAALSLLMFYFLLFQREAERSSSFPATGTLFGIFLKNRFSHSVFLALIALPPIFTFILASHCWYPSERIGYAPSFLVTLSTFCLLVMVLGFLIARQSIKARKKFLKPVSSPDTPSRHAP